MLCLLCKLMNWLNNKACNMSLFPVQGEMGSVGYSSPGIISKLHIVLVLFYLVFCLNNGNFYYSTSVLQEQVWAIRFFQKVIAGHLYSTYYISILYISCFTLPLKVTYLNVLFCFYFTAVRGYRELLPHNNSFWCT